MPIVDYLPEVENISQNVEFTPPNDYEKLFAISKFKYDYSYMHVEYYGKFLTIDVYCI